MTLITTFLAARYQELYHHLFLPLLPYLHLFLTTHFTPFSLAFQVLLTTLSFHLLPFKDVATSLFFLYFLDHAIPFAFSSTLSFFFPLELYQGEVEFIVSCCNVGLLAAGGCIEGLKSLIRCIYPGVHLLYSSTIRAAQGARKLWVKACLVGRIKASREWVEKNVARVEFIWNEVVAVVEDTTPIVAESGAEPVIERVIPLPPVGVYKPPPVKERPPPRCPSPFKSSSRSNLSDRQKSDLYHKSSDYYRQHGSNSSKDCLTVVNRASIWNVPAGRGRKPVPVVGFAVWAAKPIIDIVAPESMIKRTKSIASMEKPATDQEPRKELARRSEGVEIELLEGVEKLPVKSCIVNNIAIGCMLAECTRENVIAQNKEEGEVKDVGVKNEKKEREEHAVEVLPIEEEPIQIRGTTELQKIETQKHSTPQNEASKDTIIEGRIKITKGLIMHTKEPEKVSAEAKQGGEYVMEGKTILFNNPTPGALGPKTALSDVAVSKDHSSTGAGVAIVSDVATATTLPVPRAPGGGAVTGSSTIAGVTPASAVTTAAAFSVPEVLHGDNIAGVSGCPIVEVLAPVRACGVAGGIQSSVLAPGLFRELSFPEFDHVTRMQDVFSPIHIVEDENLEDNTVEMEQCEELDLEVTGDKDEEMIDEWDRQAVGDEEMDEAPFNPQMMDKAQLLYEDPKGQVDTMDDISYTSENCESQEMEIEEPGLEVTFSQEMEIEEIGLGVTSSQEMETEETGLEVISIQRVNTGAAEHQSFFIAPFMAAPACYFPSVPTHDILLEPTPMAIPTSLFSPGMPDPLTTCQVVSGLTSESITHTPASPIPTCSIPLVPNLSTVKFAPAPALDVSDLASLAAIPGNIQMPVTSVSIAAPTITPVPAFLPALAVATGGAPAPPKTQHLEIATASSSSSRTFQPHHESVTVTTAATDETSTPVGDGEVTGPKVLDNILKAQYEIIGIETQSPAAVETPAVVETPTRYWKEKNASSSQTSSPRRQYQAVTPSTPTTYRSSQHVETSTASSSRVPTPKRPFEPDANSRRDTPGPKKVARIIAPLKKSIYSIAPTNPTNDPAKPLKDVKGKGKSKAIEIEETWSDNDEDAFHDMGIDALRDTSAEEKRVRRDYYIKNRED